MARMEPTIAKVLMPPASRPREDAPIISGCIPVVATIGARGGGFIAEVKCMPACELWQVTHTNRDHLHARILTWLAERTSGFEAV